MEPTRHQKALVETAAEIWQDSPEELAFQHVVLAHLGFPRSKTDALTFERVSGTTALHLAAGPLWDGQRMVQQSLPYGSIPRLMMIAITTRAIQQKARVVELGRSMRDSLRELGLADTGAAHWARVRAQAGALSAVRMTLGYVSQGKPTTLNAQPVKKFDAWLHRDERQLTLMPSTVELSADFFEAIQDASVPLDVRAVRALSKHPMALDVYTWLAHRLCRVRSPEGDRIPWLKLREQFGQEIGDQKEFKKQMKLALRKAQTVYPQARLDTWGSGLTLLPSPPPIPKERVVVALPRRA